MAGGTALRLGARSSILMLALLSTACSGGTSSAPPPLPVPSPGLVVTPLTVTTSGVSAAIPAYRNHNAIGLVSTSFATPSPTQVMVALNASPVAASAAVPATAVVPTLSTTRLRDRVIADGPVRRTTSEASRPSLAHRAAAAIGATQNFYVASGSIGQNDSKYTNTPFTLSATTANTSIWFATSIAAQYAQMAKQIANDIETSLQSDVTWLGLPPTFSTNAVGLTQTVPTCDSNGIENGTGPAFVAPYSTIDVLIVPAGALGPSTGGQFVQSDLSPQNVANCSHALSNQTADITIALDPSYTNVDFFFQIFAAHEVTHLIAYVNSAITLGRPGPIPGFIDEGIAQLSEDVALGHPNYSNISDAVVPFLQAPQKYALLTMNGIQDGVYAPYTLGNYGAAYLMMRYLADRTGLGFARTYLLTDPTTSLSQSFSTLATAAGAASFSQLFENFGTTLAASNEGAPVTSTFTISSFALAGTYTGASTTAASTSFTFPGVSAAATLPGSTTSPMFPGGISILTVSKPLDGTTVGIVDPSNALALNGSIVSY